MSVTIKAIKVSTETKNVVQERFGLDDDEVEEFDGFYAIAGFGEETLYDGLMSEADLNKYYEVVQPLENGFTEYISRT